MRKREKELYKMLDSWETKLVKWLRKTRPVIYTVLRHVSNSGMLRKIDVYVIKNNEPWYINHLVSKLTGYSIDKETGSIRISGCGMDMGFSLVYNFSSHIFPYGFKYRKNEWHRNNDPSPIDKSGGYALKHKWL